MRGLVIAVAFAAGCGGLSEGSEWFAASDITGDLAADLAGDSFTPSVQTQLRIASFNVEFGADTEGLAAAMVAHPELRLADVWLLQEIESYPGEPGSRARRLAQALSMNHAYVPERLEGNGTHGLAILSRLPIANVERMRLPSQATLVRPRNKIAVRADIVVGGAMLQVASVHLDLRLNLANRILQMHPVVESADATSIIGGDINTNPYVWADSLPIIPADVVTDSDHAQLFDDYMEAYGFDTPLTDIGPTQNAGVAEFRLDAVFSRQVEVVDVGIAADVEVSDHRPVWVDVEL